MQGYDKKGWYLGGMHGWMKYPNYYISGMYNGNLP